MAHFAKIVDGVVETVIVADQDHIDTLEGAWVKTSYNMIEGVYYVEFAEDDGDGGTRAARKAADDQSIITGDEARERKNYAGIGYGYDGVGFFSPKPYNSWLFNATTYQWDSPVAYPEEDKIYTWNEENLAWEER
tara:strand:- start:126 stop:530 length:405 start_codon:yes stop_codon:yes gene_type:complete